MELHGCPSEDIMSFCDKGNNDVSAFKDVRIFFQFYLFCSNLCKNILSIAVYVLSCTYERIHDVCMNVHMA